MGRTKGATNKFTLIEPLHTTMSVDERLTFLANLIINKIQADESNGRKLFNVISGQRNEPITTS